MTASAFFRELRSRGRDRARSRAARSGGLALAAGALLVALPVCGEPLDPLDANPRPILLEFEISSDPSAVGQSYSAPYPASYSASGDVGTVTLAGDQYESYLDTYGGPGGSIPLPETFSDYTIEIDLTTLEATASAFGLLIYPSGSLSTDVSTTRSGGFVVHPEVDGPLFCDPLTFPECTAVATAPYDPDTGKLNAVGFDRVSFHTTVDLFSYAGDLRLSERPPPEEAPATSGWSLALLAALLLGGGSVGLRGVHRGESGAA